MSADTAKLGGAIIIQVSKSAYEPFSPCSAYEYNRNPKLDAKDSL